LLSLAGPDALVYCRLRVFYDHVGYDSVRTGNIMTKYIIRLTCADEGDGLRPTFYTF